MDSTFCLVGEMHLNSYLYLIDKTITAYFIVKFFLIIGEEQLL